MDYELIISQTGSESLSPYDGLDPQQLDAVKSPPGPLLIIAGAGTGKTKTLISRVGHLLVSGVPPERIMLCTFTIKAAREMVDRLTQMMGNADRIWAGTFHHIGNRILRLFGERIGIGNDFTVMDSEDAKEFLHGVMHDLGASAPLTASKLISVFSFALSTQSSLENVIRKNDPDLGLSIDLISKIFEEYSTRKIRRQVVDFDDLLALWKYALISDSTLSEEVTSMFDHILVDEYQDTNRLQGDIINLMAKPHGNITVVGDDAQAIYSFRGATPDNIWNFFDVYPSGVLAKIENNYRSVPPILSLANAIIAETGTKFKKTLSPVLSGDLIPVYLQVRDEIQQAQFIAQRLWELHMEHSIELGEISILYRTHKQALELEMELTRRQIPFNVSGSMRIFEQAHFKDVISYLRLVHNPFDEVALLRYFKFAPGLGTATVRKLIDSGYEFDPASIPDNMHLYLAVVKTDPELYRNAPLVREAEFFNNLAAMKHDLPRLLKAVVSSYEPIALRKFENAADRLAELNQLVEVSSQYTGFDQFLTDLGLSGGPVGEAYAVLEEPKDRITLSTVHQAKGLEWKAVFIAGVTEGLFPLAFARTKESLDEERRLFHVAVTRAKEHLYLVHPLMGSPKDRNRNIRRVSRFLSEIPSSHYQTWNIKTVTPV